MERDGFLKVIPSCNVRFVETETCDDLIAKIAASDDAGSMIPTLTLPPQATTSEDTLSLLGGPDKAPDDQDNIATSVMPLAQQEHPAAGHNVPAAPHAPGEDLATEENEDASQEVRSRGEPVPPSGGDISDVGVTCSNNVGATNATEIPENSSDDGPPGPPEPRRSTRKPMPRMFPDAYLLGVQADILEAALLLPESLAEARSRADALLWEEAYERECVNLIEKKVYTVVERKEVPADKKIVKTRIVAAIKKDDKGHITEYKMRIVAKGFMQQAGWDFYKTAAPTVRTATIHAILAHAISEGWCIRQIDVKAAFLNGKLKEETYVEPPPGHSANKNEVWKLDKALYGLKQAAEAWSRTWCTPWLHMCSHETVRIQESRFRSMPFHQGQCLHGSAC